MAKKECWRSLLIFTNLLELRFRCKEERKKDDGRLALADAQGSVSEQEVSRSKTRKEAGRDGN